MPERLISFTVCCNILIILQCGMYNPSLIRIHRLEGNRPLRSLHLIRNVICQIIKRLFYYLKVILRINLDSYIIINILIDYQRYKILQRIQCLSSLTNQNTHIIAV